MSVFAPESREHSSTVSLSRPPLFLHDQGLPQDLVQARHSIIAVKRLTPVALGGDGDRAVLGEEPLHLGVTEDPPFLLPAQHRRSPEVKHHPHLGFDLVDILPPWPRASGGFKEQLGSRDAERLRVAVHGVFGPGKLTEVSGLFDDTFLALFNSTILS